MTTGGTSTTSSGGHPSALDTGQQHHQQNHAVDIPNNLAQLSEGWLELESDPGLFTSLIGDFGCRGVQVEEIYDLERPFTEQQPTVYGFIFLFNVIEERRNRRGLGVHQSDPAVSSLLTGDYIDDEAALKQMFFASQKVPNSCATHAILSVLMNCSDILDIGPMLKRLREYTRDMDPEAKGYAISNMAELARAHNNHAAPLSSQREQTKQSAASNAVRISQRHTSSCEAFHFVSFVPIGGRLIEIDGLKNYPIDHGPVDSEPGGWTEKFRQLIRARIETPVGVEHDIRYNLMAVIPSKYEQSAKYLRAMQMNRLRLLKIIQILEFSSALGIYWDHNYSRYGLLEAGGGGIGRTEALEDETKTKKEDSIEWPEPSSLTRCPGTLQLEIEDEKVEERANFKLKYEFPQAVMRDVLLEDHRQHQQPSEEQTSTPPTPDRPESVYSDASTETASQASSSYNHQFDDEDELEDTEWLEKLDELGEAALMSATTSDGQRRRLHDRKFFVCKFEYRPEMEMGKVSEAVDKVKVDDVQNTTHSPAKLAKLEPPSAAAASGDDSKSMSSDAVPVSTDTPKDEDADRDTAQLHHLLEQFRTLKSRTTWTHSQFEADIKPRILADLLRLLNSLNGQIAHWSRSYREEQKCQERARLDDSRRVHDYDTFITTFLSMFFEQGLMDQVLDKEVYLPAERSSGSASASIVERPSITKSMIGPNGNKVTITRGPTGPLVNLSNHHSINLIDPKLAAESLKLDYENSLFFPANFSVATAAGESIPISSRDDLEDDEEN